MNKTIQIAPVRKTILVDAEPQSAFAVFTAGINRWWPKTHSLGAAPVRKSVIEPFAGGRWYTECEDGSEVTVGHVRVWEPGARLVFSWQVSAAWKAEPRVAFASEVEVRFLPETGGRTRVELEHRDFERMGGADGEKMRKDVDGGWPALLELFSRSAAGAQPK